MAGQRVPILVYHHVYPDGSDELAASMAALAAEDSPRANAGAGVIGEAGFRSHLRCLRDLNYEVISTSRLVDWLKPSSDAGADRPHGPALPEKAAVLHFDNGWLDTATVAMPILQEFGFTGTCFPITDGVEARSQGRGAAVRTQTEGVVDRPFMTWDEVQRLLDAGWEIGAHTATHCKVVDKHAAEGDQAVLWEAQTSNDLFEKHLGFAPGHFAYPSGSRNARTDELLSTIYRSLRLWEFSWPVAWTFTDRDTPRTAIACQNLDLRVPYEAVEALLIEATEPTPEAP